MTTAEYAKRIAEAVRDAYIRARRELLPVDLDAIIASVEPPAEQEHDAPCVSGPCDAEGCANAASYKLCDYHTREFGSLPDEPRRQELVDTVREFLHDVINLYPDLTACDAAKVGR